MTSDIADPWPRFLPLGDAAWTVQFGKRIDPATHARVLGFSAALADARARGELSADLVWVPAFCSLTVHFDPATVDSSSLAGQLKVLAEAPGQAAARGPTWWLPVCFDTEFAPDLAAVATAKGMPPEEVVRRLTSTCFEVYMIGFLPGFPYLGGLPEALEMPRLATPRTLVPARSIAIAGRSCAAYPWPSPGGWRLLGRTPVPLFDVRCEQRPALLAPGDRVCWYAVERTLYAELEARYQSEGFDRATLQAEAAP